MRTTTVRASLLLFGAAAAAAHAQGALQYFGYDDGAENTADLTETYSYTNLDKTNPQCVPSANCGSCTSVTSIVSPVGAMAAKGVKAMVDLSQVLFCAASGHWQLRSDYAASWQAFRTANAAVLDANHVASFYIMDEPTLNGVTAAELASATTLIKNSYPTLPTSTVEAFVSIGNLVIPTNMDWVGIDEYVVGYPATDITYQNALQVLKSKLKVGQKIIYVMDSYWMYNYAHGQNGWTESQLGCVGWRWYSLAASDPDAVALGGFIWPSSTQPATCATDHNQYCGTEDLPQVVRDLHAVAGTAVTGKALVYSMFTRQVPASNLASAPFEVGTQFSSTVAGSITAIRYYKPSGESGTHVGRIWDDATGALLAAVTFTGETGSGWQTQALGSPLAISANHKYRVSYNFNSNLSKTVSGLASPIANGTLSALAGCYSTPPGTFPSTMSTGNGFADVLFHPTTLPNYSCSALYQGYHDHDGCDVISGWAWDSNQLNPPISVDLYNGASLLAAQVPANLFRQDLLNAGIGNGFHAWVYDYKTRSPSLADGQPHLIRVKIANTQTDLAWTPRWFTCGGAHAPYHGSPSPIPGTIQAEDFDTGGEGIAYHDSDAANVGGQYRTREGVDIATCTDGTGCYTVGWAHGGEWLLYTVSVPTAGIYTLQVRVASAGGGGTFHVEFNGTNKSGSLTVPNTGGWDTWQTMTKTMTLDAGWQVMKLVLEANGTTGYVGNFNYLRF